MIIIDGPVVGGPNMTVSGSKTIFRFPDPKPAPRSKGPTHADSFGVVYVNGVGRAAMLSEGRVPFPEGSIIVREKLARADDERPEVLAVMSKRGRGFNPKAGDWEFLLVDGAMTKVKDRQKTGSCSECHAQQRKSDYVFPPPAPL